MKKITFSSIEPLLDKDAIIKGNKKVYFTNIQTSEHINNKSLDWVNPIKKNKVNYIKNSKASVMLVELSLLDELELDNFKVKCLIFVKNPKLTFLRIAKKFLTKKFLYGIHPTASVHTEAEIDAKCYIGPHTYIGICKIGKGTIIHGNCHIYDNTIIGENVTIDAGTVIGAEGFGYQRNEKGEFERFPHIGGVIIKDNVDIGSNTSIDRGALGNTLIEEGAKIDNLVHIAHNVKVGKHSAVIANTMVGGSAIIGNYAWVAPSVALRDQISVGDNSIVGMGAVVTKNIPDSQTWTGSPAKPLDEFIKLQKTLKNCK